MSLTQRNLLLERPHAAGIGGVQRIYRFADGHGLSLVNSPKLHVYPFAWEAAVLKGVTENGEFEDLDYDTELTNDVEVFQTEKEANHFIDRAAKLFGPAVTD